MQESCHLQYDLVCSSTGLLGNFPDHQKHSEAYFVAVFVLLVLEVLGCPQRLGCVFHLSDLFYFSDLFGIGFYHHLLIMCQLLLFQTLWCKCMIQVIPSLSNCTCYSLDILGSQDTSNKPTVWLLQPKHTTRCHLPFGKQRWQQKNSPGVDIYIPPVNRHSQGKMVVPLQWYS